MKGSIFIMKNIKLNETPVRTAKNFRINNIKLENTLLENLYMTKLLLETKSENRSKKSKIKKLI